MEGKVKTGRVCIKVCNMKFRTPELGSKYAVRKQQKAGHFCFFAFLCWIGVGYGEVISYCELWNVELGNADRVDNASPKCTQS